MLSPLPDAEAQCAELAALIRPSLQADTTLVGIHSGGAWIARRVQTLLGLPGEAGVIDVSFHRDDYRHRGLHPQVQPTQLPFAVDARPMILIDDVLFTGRTTRAAINELFDYGRPRRIQLAVLADRGGRELPCQPDFCVWRPQLAEREELILEATPDGRLQWRCDPHA